MHSPTQTRPEPALGRLFDPRGVAVIGASADAAKLSGRPMEYLRRFGFQGRVVGVNPKYDAIAGFPCVPRVEDLPDGVDLALILVQAPGVADALEACGRRGIGFAISIAAGFAEAGDHAGQERLAAICRRYGIRLIGPNCVGLVAPGNGLAATFSTEVGRTMPRPGGIALVTQSGALGNAMIQNFNAYGIGLRAWVSTGNEADLHCLDLVEHFIDDPETTAIGLFVEGLREGPRLLPLLRRARRAGKPVVALRAGRSEAGRGASASHTGKLAGRAAVWDGIVRQGGMIEARSLEHMVDIFRAMEAFGGPASGSEPSLGVLTVSGGLGVIVSDHAEEQGLRLARFGPGTRDGLRGLLPPQMSVANPVDTALFTDAGGFGTCARLVLEDGDVDTLVIVISSMSHDYGQIVPWLCELGRTARATGRRIGVTYLAASDQFALEDQRALLAAGVLALPSAERLLAALGALRAGGLRDGPADGAAGECECLPRIAGSGRLRIAGVLPAGPQRA
jgi:acetate---CoA ligase (ADP-forming)